MSNFVNQGNHGNITTKIAEKGQQEYNSFRFPSSLTLNIRETRGSYQLSCCLLQIFQILSKLSKFHSGINLGEWNKQKTKRQKDKKTKIQKQQKDQKKVQYCDGSFELLQCFTTVPLSLHCSTFSIFKIIEGKTFLLVL